jgi:integrase
MAKLTVRAVQAQKVPGFYADGDGLYLQVAPGGSRSWIYRYQREGRRREMGLGSLDAIGLAEAREKATAARRMLAAGADPIEARRTERSKAEVVVAKVVTFKDCADRYIAAHKTGWRNPKHRAQWTATLETYAYPHFGTLPVEAVDVGLVLQAVEPIWSTKPETAGRVRGRIESIIDWAKARGYRDGENPARWRGHLENLLPARSKVRRVNHHAALPYPEIGAFLVALREQEGVAARALEFTILTAARTGEALGARWDEIDIQERMWIIPAERMKASKEHRVPLSRRAVAILEEMAAIKLNEFVFPGWRTESNLPLSNMAMLMTLRRMGRGDLTVHGFRSTFRDWCAERTAFPAEVAELALAHAVGNKVEAAYRRGDQFEKRRQLADAWAAFCAAPAIAGDVVPIRAPG